MEIADIFAINKADMPSAAKMATEVKRIVALTHRGDSADGGGRWVPPVVLTSQANPDSIVRLSAEVDRHGEWLRASGEQAARALARRRYWLRRWLERNAQQIIDRELAAFFEMPRARQMAILLERLGSLPGGQVE